MNSHEVVDHRDLLRRWNELTSREAWEIEPGDLHNMVDEAVDQIESLRQALWDIYGILGFDQDGDETPRALSFPALETLVRDAAREYRADVEEGENELLAEIKRLRP